MSDITQANMESVLCSGREPWPDGVLHWPAKFSLNGRFNSASSGMKMLYRMGQTEL